MNGNRRCRSLWDLSFFVPQNEELELIFEEEYLLVTKGNFTWVDCELMTPLERGRFTRKLVEQLKKEQDAHEKAAAKMKSKSQRSSRFRH